MKTLLMAPALFTGDGGIPRILCLYLRALSDLAPRVSKVRFLSLNDAIADSNDLRRYTGPNLDAWSVCHRNKTRFVRDTLKLSRGCNHIVCGHIRQLPVALAARLMNPSLNVDLIAHGIEVWQRPSPLIRAALRRTRSILCVSEYTRNRMREYNALPLARMKVVHNGLDAFFNIPPTVAPPPQPPVILCVSRLSKADSYKGVDTLIEAMPSVLEKQPEAILRIIGQGDDTGRLRQLVGKLKLAKKVELLGFISDKELSAQLQDCTLFALPSRGEGFGLVYLEAMAKGKPCIAARAGGAPEVITPETGMLVEYGDLPAISDAIVQALERTWNAKLILARAREFSYPRFKDQLAAALPLPPA